MFKLQKHLENYNQSVKRRFSFKANSQVELIEWQRQFRDELSKLLGIANRPLPDSPYSELLSKDDKGRYYEEKYTLAIDDVLVPLFLLIPKTPPPHKVILAFHGHGPGVQLILGNERDPATRATHLAVDENFAQHFAEDGYMVCAIEQQGFGERTTQQTNPDKSFNSCRHLSFAYMMQGRNLLGERVREGMASLNWMLSRPDVVRDSIYCTGHSGGGATALFLAALDTRLTTAVISGYFCSYQYSILGMPHCECNYVPHLLMMGDIGEIAALVAPRRLCLINGRQDPIFPEKGVGEPYQTVKHAYDSGNASDACSLIFHSGAHRYDYDSSLNYIRG